MESARLMSIVSLADSHNKSITEVLTTYPAWEIPYWQVYQSKNANKCGSSTENLLAQILIWVERYATNNKSKTQMKDILLSKKWNKDLLSEETKTTQTVNDLSAEMMG